MLNRIKILIRVLKETWERIELETWRCYCGRRNAEEFVFCQNCGRSKSSMTEYGKYGN